VNMSNRTLFDIETGPRDQQILAALMPAFSAPANYKDPEKIAANIAEQKNKWLEQAALSPVTGRVIVIGFQHGTAPAVILEAASEADEARILAAFWAEVQRHPSREWAGWNIHGFDLDFLVKRSWFHRLAVPMHLIMSGRYVASRWNDLMKAFQAPDWKAPFTSLEDAARFLEIDLGGKDDGVSARFAQVYAEDREKALAHARNDLRLAAAVGEVIAPEIRAEVEAREPVAV
jgi:hypothetical protein